tara:strand:- start:170 stop:346 length:177 start_codon:yes stop_codon:yes gene_type:complete
MKKYVKIIFICLCVVAWFALLGAAIAWVDTIETRPGQKEMLAPYEGSSGGFINRVFGN